MVGPWATPQNQVLVAQRAEALGYHSIWVFQRLLYPIKPQNDYPPMPGQPWPKSFERVMDPLVSLAFVAGVTSRIRLGTSVLIMPYYTPVMLAKQLATLDIVSGGRLDVGLGLGWSTDEFDAVGVPYSIAASAPTSSALPQGHLDRGPRGVQGRVLLGAAGQSGTPAAPAPAPAHHHRRLRPDRDPSRCHLRRLQWRQCADGTGRVAPLVKEITKKLVESDIEPLLDAAVRYKMVEKKGSAPAQAHSAVSCRCQAMSRASTSRKQRLRPKPRRASTSIPAYMRGTLKVRCASRM
jgi:hypothetical protein